MKNNKKLIFPLLIFLGIGVICFYWYEMRPSKIKHDCSWIIDRREEAKEAIPAMTESELKEKGWLPDCSQEKIDADIKKSTGVYKDFLIRKKDFTLESCKVDYQKKIEEYKNNRPATEARDIWRKTTNEEYIFCLRDKGL